MNDEPFNMIFDPRRLIEQAAELENLCSLYKTGRIFIYAGDVGALVLVAQKLDEKFSEPKSYQQMLMQKMHRRIYTFAVASSAAHLAKIDDAFAGLIIFMEHSAAWLR